ncbi:MAG: hypothetical protein LC754_07460 [Acidobacteria bacterium]|nr:hypothetical protein [Acidobacteriota bacterium]
MNNRQGFIQQLVAVALRVALVVALCASVWGIYRRLPRDERTSLDDSSQAVPTALRIVVRRSSGMPAAAGKLPVQLYPINVMAAQREYDSEHRPGVRFDDFITRRMGGRQPLSGELDERGETVIAVPPGKWWVHATLGGAEELTWRLPVNVSGREASVELTPENAYARAKSF